MKYFFILLFLVVSLGAKGQKLTYPQWKELSKGDVRLLPEYGNVAKTPEQKTADKQLIDDEIKQNGSARKAAEALVALGFKYLYSGDLKTAMYRFNQAWLLDSKDENVYWGYSVIYFSFQ